MYTIKNTEGFIFSLDPNPNSDHRFPYFEVSYHEIVSEEKQNISLILGITIPVGIFLLIAIGAIIFRKYFYEREKEKEKKE